MAAEPNPTNTREVFLRRLGWYAVGLAIGFMMLGMIWKARRAAEQRRIQGQSVVERPEAQPSPEAPTP